MKEVRSESSVIFNNCLINLITAAGAYNNFRWHKNISTLYPTDVDAVVYVIYIRTQSKALLWTYFSFTAKMIIMFERITHIAASSCK